MSLFQDIEGAAERGREAPGIHRNGTTGLIEGGKLLVPRFFGLPSDAHGTVEFGLEVGFFLVYISTNS